MVRYLKDILYQPGVTGVTGPSDIEILALESDSRLVRPGDLYFAVRGSASDGHVFIPDAIKAGASAVVCQQMPGELSKEVTYVLVEDSSYAKAIIASNFYGNPSAHLNLTGVTGTNGKTTTVTLLYQLFNGLGYKTGLISTILNKIDDQIIPATHTTPDPVKLNEMLARMVAVPIVS
jgi:UDP-N-acetylmuramoyl-L-alanyl-D-glutamate--2,6-diaminopimelate ligase